MENQAYQPEQDVEAGGTGEKQFPTDPPPQLQGYQSITAPSTDAFPPKDAAQKQRTAPLQPYAGMNREDLLYFSQQKFWVRLRTSLLVFFGICWIGLLVAIVTLTIIWPRCKSPPRQQWWQSSRIYSIYVPTYYDSNDDGIGDLKGIEEKLDYIESLHVSAIHLSAIYKSANEPVVDQGYEVVDQRVIWDKLGSDADMDSLIGAAHKREIKVLIDFIPSYTSDKHMWFEKFNESISSATPDEYSNYYIAKDCPLSTYPNNWLSVYNGSAWENITSAGKCYLHQFLKTQPQLNLRSNRVVKELESIMNFWVGKGIDGFKIIDTTFMYVDNDFRDEVPLPNTNPPYAYNDLIHNYTRAQSDIHNLIAKWRYQFDNKDGGPVILLTDADENFDEIMNYYYYIGRKGSNVPMNYPFSNSNENCKSECIMNRVSKWMNDMGTDSTANWMTGTQNSNRLANRQSKNWKIHNLLKMTLPGLAINYYGEEIGMQNGQLSSIINGRDPTGLNRDIFRTPMQWDHDRLNYGFSNASQNLLYINISSKPPGIGGGGDGISTKNDTYLKTFRNLASLKKRKASLQYGKIELLNGLPEHVFAFIRRYNGQDNFLIVVNLGDESRTINFVKIHDRVPSSGTVAAVSGNDSGYRIDDDKDIDLDSVGVKGGEGVVFTWEFQRSLKDKND